MSKYRQLLQTLSITLLSIPASVYADSWSCRHDNNVREIHIVRESSAPVPCSVLYKKLTEGVEDQTLWNATSDANYCEEKAKEFVARQEGWGWTCVETISDITEPADATTEEATPATETAPAAESAPTEAAPATETAPAEAQ